MTEITDSGEPGRLAKIRWIDEHGKTFFDLPDGRTGWINSTNEIALQAGDVVLLHDDWFEVVPDSVWTAESWVGVVRIRLPDVTVVDSGGQARIVPTKDLSYSVGNTVQVNGSGVLRVLDEKPIRFLDLPEVDDSAVQDFIFDRGENTLGFDDFGGMPDVVIRARRLIETPLQHKAELDAIGARRVKGVLFTGAPGTGKTLLARIIAAQSDATFYQVRGPEIVSKWYGQSEELLRKLFEHAQKQPSAIIFFDEIDSVAAQRDEDAHEASRRLVAQLLTLMDGFKPGSNVVVIATTNRPQDIDSALRRPGRFDWEIEFPTPTESDRLSILRASAKPLATVVDLPHGRIAELTEGWSAAELAAIWTEAAMLAAGDGRKRVMAEDYFGGFEAVQQLRERALSPSKGIER